MRKILALFLIIFIVSVFFFTKATSADTEQDLRDIEKQISDLKNQLELSVKATTPLESEVKSLESQLASINTAIFRIQQDLAKSEEDLAQQKKILAATVRSFYIGSFVDIPLLTFFSSGDATEALRNVALQQESSREDKNIIADISGKITKLADDKKRLAAAQKQVNQQSQFFKGEIAKAKSFQSEIEGQIASLSARQQEILAARSGQFTASIGNSELADDYNASIVGFRESAPGGSFAVFSFGGHTHRKGMSQYGARGRAQAGQDYKAILKAYYGKDPVNKDTGGSIKVAGQGEINFETTYLFGIAEMPSSWDTNALKAQAIAARTYAYRYKQEGKEICITEACQVFSKSKSDIVSSDPNHSWRKAVEQTKGEVLEDVVTYYASTHGGFASPIGWDTTDGSGGGNFVDKSYDKAGGSPWVYKAWYTKGYSPSSEKCGRSNPWLSSGEMADLINAYYVLHGSGSGADTGRVTPITTSCWGGNPYSHDDLRNVSGSYGGGISSVSGVSVSQGNGTTSEVIFQTNQGEKRLSGTNFKKTFNIRAPGYLQIPQFQFAFYNIEKK
ncbi:MAG: SpoIID/LytB domain-containing protein [Candidatus Curtissbacteria bacterium]|nr:SpoIID/LytB domain-containing protein [Candidatus Curtissbacteria bacterium]